MKKFIITAISLLVVLSVSAQEKQFNEALNKGRQTGRFYRMTNTKAKMITKKKVEKLASERDFILSNYSTKEIGRFGDVATTIKTWDFIPRSEYTLYIGENLNKGTKASDYTQKGTAFITDMTRGELRMKTYNNVQWTGQVKNGRIDGAGHGLIKNGDLEFVAFEGTFSEGVPQGELKIHLYTPAIKEVKYNAGHDHQYQASLGHKSEGMTSVKFKDKFGFINSSGEIVAIPKYKKVKDFKNGVAYVTQDNVEMKIDKTGTVIALSENAKLTFADMLKMRKEYPQLAKPIENYALSWAGADGRTQDELADVNKEFPNLKSKIDQLKARLYQKDCRQLEAAYARAAAAAASSSHDLTGKQVTSDFISVYTKHSYDPDYYMPKAKALKGYQDVCDALDFSLLSSYWTDDYRPTFSGEGDTHRTKITNALSVCANQSDSAFVAFYSQAQAPLRDKLGRLDSQLASDRRDYERSYARYQREEARREAERRAEEARREEKRRQALAALDDMSASRIYAYIVDEGEWSGGRMIDTDDDFEDSKEIEFRDIESDYEGATFTRTIYHVFSRKRGVNYYYFSSGFLGSKSYTNEMDAIIGVFMNRYSKDWDHGRK